MQIRRLVLWCMRDVRVPCCTVVYVWPVCVCFFCMLPASAMTCVYGQEQHQNGQGQQQYALCERRVAIHLRRLDRRQRGGPGGCRRIGLRCRRCIGRRCRIG